MASFFWFAAISKTFRLEERDTGFEDVGFKSNTMFVTPKVACPTKKGLKNRSFAKLISKSVLALKKYGWLAWRAFLVKKRFRFATQPSESFLDFQSERKAFLACCSKNFFGKRAFQATKRFRRRNVHETCFWKVVLKKEFLEQVKIMLILCHVAFSWKRIEKRYFQSSFWIWVNVGLH